MFSWLSKSPCSCCCCRRASLLSRASCLFSSMRLRCSSDSDTVAGAGVECMKGSSGKSASPNGSSGTWFWGSSVIRTKKVFFFFLRNVKVHSFFFFYNFKMVSIHIFEKNTSDSNHIKLKVTEVKEVKESIKVPCQKKHSSYKSFGGTVLTISIILDIYTISSGLLRLCLFALMVSPSFPIKSSCVRGMSSLIRLRQV